MIVLFMGAWVGAALAARPAFTTTKLERVAFVSPTRGVGLFLTAGASSPRRCVWYTRETRDGGASFGGREVPFVSGRCGTAQRYSQLAVNSAGVLFAYGPGIAVSRDMGRTWSSPTLPGSVVSLATHGPTAWALVTRCHVGQQTCRLTLLSSANGGSTWRQSASQPPDRVISSPVAFAAELGMSTLLSASPARAPLLALPAPLRQTSKPSRPIATVEQLTGSRWLTSRATCTAGGYQSELSVASDASAWLVCASEPSAGAQIKSLAVSADGGLRWRTVEAPCIPGRRCHDRMPINDYLDGLFALNSRTAFYVGGRSSLTGSFDGGRSWRAWSRIGDDSNGTLQVTFAGPSHGWALAEIDGGGIALWRTTNGGRTWSRL